MVALASDLVAALDAVAFARHAGIEPDDWQADVLRSDARQIIMACGRQVGKSTVLAVAALHEAVYSPGALVLLVSASQRQASELFAVVSRFADRIGEPVRDRSTLKLTTASGSRILSLPASPDTIRGFPGASLVICDEAAFIGDPVFTAIMPSLATSGGRLILASTPNGTSGFFADVWRDGGEEWEQYQVRSDECGRIDPGFLARQRLLMTDAQYRAEYEAAFTDASGAVFRADDLARLIDEGSEEWEL